MGKKRLTMRQIKEVLRQYHDLELNISCVSRATKIPRTTVQDYIGRFKVSGLSWPLPTEVDNEKLNELLFPIKVKTQRISPPDWKEIHQELKRKGVTLQILWEEYKRKNPTGYQYSRFAYLYRQWAKSLRNVSAKMRQLLDRFRKLIKPYFLPPVHLEFQQYWVD